jgi:hypothetical protein
MKSLSGRKPPGRPNEQRDESHSAGREKLGVRIEHIRQHACWRPFSASDVDDPTSAAPLSRFPDAPFVSISDNQRAPLSEANWLGTIYHGLPTDLFRPFEVGSRRAISKCLTDEVRNSI